MTKKQFKYYKIQKNYQNKFNRNSKLLRKHKKILINLEVHISQLL